MATTCIILSLYDDKGASMVAVLL